MLLKLNNIIIININSSSWVGNFCLYTSILNFFFLDTSVLSHGHGLLKEVRYTRTL